MDKLLIVSSDNHAGGRAADYIPYFEPAFREAARGQVAEEAEFVAISSRFSTFPPSALEIIDDRHAIRSGGEDGGWDLERRLKELDDEGCAAEIVHAGHQKQLCPFFTHISRAYPAPLRSAGARAHHRWFVDHMGPANGRIFGVADPGGTEDMAAAVRELHWCADHGFVATSCPGTIKDEALPPLYDPYYEPFWQAAVDRSLVLSMHTGWGSEQGAFFAFQAQVQANPALAADLERGDIEAFIEKTRKLRGRTINLGPRRAFWQMIIGGVFDRHPTLRLAFAEVRSDWLPDTLAYLDERFEKEGGVSKLKPSEYFQRQGYATPSSPRRSEIDQRDRLGIDKLMFGADYPHPEGTWPNSLDWLSDVLAGLTEAEARRFAGENAVDCFGLDGARLREIAARIGPDITGIISSERKLDAAVISHFNARAGYSNPAEVVDRRLIEEAVDADLEGARAIAA